MHGRRWISFLILAVILLVIQPAAAQDSNDIEALALRVHLQNLRTFSYTYWVGGNMGDAVNALPGSVIGEKLNRWHLKGMDGDPDADAEDLTRPVLLNFWASWCLPCRLEFPHLVDVALAPEEHEFDILFVNTSDAEGSALAFLSSQPEEIHAVLDERDRLSVRAQIDTIPMSLLLDTDGTVLVVHAGMMTPTVAAFLDAVAANPGQGAFNAARHQQPPPGADLLPVNVVEATPIQPDEQVYGTITDDDFQHVYSFEGRIGEQVIITQQAEGSELDTYLVLMTSDGIRLAENDDRDAGTDSQIEIMLPADDTYLVVATRFLEAEGFAGGEYSLLLTIMGSEISVEDVPTQNIIGYNSQTFGTVSPANPRQIYAFEGHRGDILGLHVTHFAGFASLQIEVLDPDMERVVLSQPSANGEVEVPDLTLAKDGMYLLMIYRTPSDNNMRLDYTLTLRVIEQQVITPTPSPLPTGGETTLVYGQTVSGTINDAHPEDRWTFAGQRGDIITLEMTRAVDEPGGLDGYLLLLGPDGSTLSEADDYNNNVMPSIVDFELPEDGVYIAIATRFGFQNGFSAGDYSLTLTVINESSSPDDDGENPPGTDDQLPAELRAIQYNEQVTGTITDELFEHWYIFYGRENDVLTIRMSGSTDKLDPYLSLTDVEGRELISNDDAAEASSDAVIEEFPLPADGAYMIRATRYGLGNGPSTGDYTLVIETEAESVQTMEDATPTPLNYGDQASGSLSLDNASDQYTFVGSEGDVITISARRERGDPDLALTLRGPDGSEIASNHAWRSEDEARISLFTLPEDGSYTLDVILENLNSSGDYSLLLLPEPDLPLWESTVIPTPGLDIELVLAWESGADLDLIVGGPSDDTNGERIDRANDACAEAATAPQERFVWESETASAGLYQVSAEFQLNCTNEVEPVSFTLTIIQQGRIMDVIQGTLAHEGSRYTVLMEYTP